ARDTTDSSLRIRTGTNWKSAAGNNQSSANKRSYLAMHEPKIVLQPQKRVRYLKIIALFKIFKGVLLFLLGFSLFFLHSRPVWLDQISDWADDQLYLAHGKPIIFLLNKSQNILSGAA